MHGSGDADADADADAEVVAHTERLKPDSMWFWF